MMTQVPTKESEVKIPKEIKALIAEVSRKTEEDVQFYDIAAAYGWQESLQAEVTPELIEVQRNGIHNAAGLHRMMSDFNMGQIAFTGPAGSGKSTLLKSIARKVMDKDYLRNVELVFFYEAQEFTGNEQITPCDLLLSGVEQTGRQKLMTFIKKHPEKFLFIIDSLDTLPANFGKGRERAIGLKNCGSPSTILYNLLAGKLLPKCRVITSSRQHAIQKFIEEIYPTKVIALVGLSRQGICDMVHGYLPEQKASTMMEYLTTTSARLVSLCSNPLFLVLALIGFDGIYNENDYHPSTMSGIMALLLQRFSRTEHARRENFEEVIHKLKELSYNCTMEKKLMFGEEDLRRVSLTKEDVTDLAILSPFAQVPCHEHSRVTFLFCHQSIQEALTAFYVAEMKSDDFKSFISETANDDHYAVVLNILSGVLLDEEIIKEAGQLIQVGSDFSTNKQTLKESFRQVLAKLGTCPKPLSFLISLFEAKDGINDLLMSIAHRRITVQGDLPFCVLSPSDAHVLGMIARKLGSLEELSLPFINLQLHSLRTLTDCFSNREVKITKINLSGNRDIVMNCMDQLGKIVRYCQVETLVLQKCDLPDAKSLKMLKDSLNDAKVKVLDWSFCHSMNVSRDMSLESIGTYQGFPTGQNLNVKLRIQCSNVFGSDRTLELCRLFQNVTEEIRLCGLKVDKECRMLMQAKLDSLPNTHLRITLGEGDTISSQKKEVCTALESSQLSGKKNEEILKRFKKAVTLGDFLKVCDNYQDTSSMFFGLQVAHDALNLCKIPLLTSVLSRISPILELELRDCGLSASLLQALNDSIHSREIQISKLTISSMNGISNMLEEICRSMNKFRTEHLSIEENNITHTDLEVILEILPKDSKLQRLDLSYNKNMTDFLVVGKIVQTYSLTELRLVNCDLTDDCIEELVRSVGKVPLLSTLDISHNLDLSEKGFRILPRLMKTEMECLIITGCDMMESDITALREEFREGTKISHLDMSYNDGLDNGSFAELSRMLSKAVVTKLSLAGCDLDEELLEAFTDASQNCKLKQLDLSDNMSIGSGIFMVADLVKKCSVQHLDMSDCMFNSEQVEGFAKQLTGFELSTLNLSDSERTSEEKYTNALCKLIPHIEEELTLCFAKMDETSRDILQKSLDGYGREVLKVKVGYGTTVDITIENIKIISKRFQEDVITKNDRSPKRPKLEDTEQTDLNKLNPILSIL